jgi:hypothetical protein
VCHTAPGVGAGCCEPGSSFCFTPGTALTWCCPNGCGATFPACM